MTKEELVEYQDLQHEIRYLTSKIKKTYSNPSSFYTADTVVGSTEANPMNRVMTIRGVNWGEYDKRVKKDSDKLRNRLEKAEKIRDSIEGFIDKIPDRCTKVIFEMRYLDNKKFHQIAMELDMGSESTPRKKHDRYLENYFNLSDCSE